MDALDDDARLAARLVKSAAELAATMRNEADLEIASKTSVSDIVTAADHAAEALMVQMLGLERPDDAILGEEGTESDGSSGRRWIIDPVDGTYNFAAGSDYWCSALALVDESGPLLGAVAHQATGTVLLGGPGLPTTCNGEPLSPIEDAALPDISAATYLHPGDVDRDAVRVPFLRAARIPATVRMLGSGSMDLVGVATRRLGSWFQHSAPPWDWFPGAAIVAGAGGTVTQIEVEGYVWSVAGPATAVAAITDSLSGVRR